MTISYPGVETRHRRRRTITIEEEDLEAHAISLHARLMD